MPIGSDTVITVSPDGTVGADFTGHVHAQGLDLDAAASNTPPDTDRIRWIRQSDGALAADISSYRFVASGTSELSQLRIGAILGQNISGNNNQAAFQSLVSGGVGGTGAVASAQVDCAGDPNESSALVLDSNGNSTFLQLDDLNRVKIIAGQVNSAGGVMLSYGRYSCTRTAIGHYTITPTVAFEQLPIAIGIPGPTASNATNQMAVSARSTTAVSFVITDPGSTAYQDAGFDFILIGEGKGGVFAL